MSLKYTNISDNYLGILDIWDVIHSKTTELEVTQFIRLLPPPPTQAKPASDSPRLFRLHPPCIAPFQEFFILLSSHRNLIKVQKMSFPGMSLPGHPNLTYVVAAAVHSHATPPRQQKLRR